MFATVGFHVHTSPFELMVHDDPYSSHVDVGVTRVQQCCVFPEPLSRNHHGLPNTVLTPVKGDVLPAVVCHVHTKETVGFTG